MRRLIALLALAAIPAFGADITATTGWTCINSSEPTGSPTIDSGSNRKFVMHSMMENNTDPAPTVTVGGESPTETVSAQITAQSNDGWHYRWTWDDTAIGNMSGTAFSYSDATGAFNKAFCYGTIEDTGQADIGALTTANNTSTTSVDVTSTSSTGDYIVCGGVAANGSSANSFTGWDTLAEIHDSDGGDGWRGGLGAGDGTDDTTTITYSATIDLSGACSVYANAAGPTFTSGPIEAPATDGFTISGTLSGSGTLTAYAVGVNPGDGAPTCTQIKSGNNDGGTSADLSANEVWTTDVANDFLLTKSGAWPRYDIHVCGSDATDDTAVTSLTDQDRSADASQTIYIPTSYASTAPFVLQSENTCDTTSGSDTVTGCADTSWLQRGILVDLSSGFADLTDIIVLDVTSSTIRLEIDANSTTSNITVTQDTYYSPTVAVGDVIEMDDANSITGTMIIEADGDLVCSSGSCSGYFTVDYNIQDVSDVIDGDFDSGPPAWTTGDDKFHVNSTAPLWDDVLAPLVFIKDVAITAEDIGSLCSDVDGQTLTIEVRTETLPTGLSLSGAGVLTGTPTAEDDVTMNITCKDTGDLYVAADQQIVVVDPLKTRRWRRRHSSSRRPF